MYFHKNCISKMNNAITRVSAIGPMKDLMIYRYRTFI
jgi:hypothetical protein